MNIIISKEDFIIIINDLQKTNDYQTGLNRYFKNHDVDGYIYQPDCSCSVVKLLHAIFGSADIDEWISYFCFELDFGRKWKQGRIKGSGKDIKLENASDLYDLLTGATNSGVMYHQ